jgi:hypothetical protein
MDAWSWILEEGRGMEEEDGGFCDLPYEYVKNALVGIICASFIIVVSPYPLNYQKSGNYKPSFLLYAARGPLHANR